MLYVLIYVDNTIITRNTTMIIQQFINNLQSKSLLRNLGSLHCFLGIEVSPTSDEKLYLTQTKLIKDFLDRTHMLTALPHPTPMVFFLKLIQYGTTTIKDSTHYKSVVGALQYLTITRPKLSFSINKVCQYMHNPGTPLEGS